LERSFDRDPFAKTGNILMERSFDRDFPSPQEIINRRQRDKPAWTKKLWVYDYRAIVHEMLKQKRLALSDFEGFIELYKAEDRSKRKAIWIPDQVRNDKVEMDSGSSPE
jgi:hypothetical protein